MSIRDLIVFDDDRVVKNDQVSKSRYANERLRKGDLRSQPSEAQREVLRKLAERAAPVQLEDSE